MNKLFEINDTTIYDIDTTILTTSSFNYTNDAIYYMNNKMFSEYTNIKYIYFNCFDLIYNIALLMIKQCNSIFRT